MVGEGACTVARAAVESATSARVQASVNYQFEKPEHFLRVYEQELVGMDVKRLLEIGVQRGGSLHYWAARFPSAFIQGVDIDPACKEASGDRVEIITLDQTDPLLENFKPNTFDVIIDDGCHWGFAQRASFKMLWPALCEGGVYVIEDLNTTHIKRFGGMWPRYGFIHDLVGLTKRIHRGPSDITKIVHYQAITFIHKGIPFELKSQVYGEVDCRRGLGIHGSTAPAMLVNRIKRLVGV